jgi:hypothetical protein
MTIEINMNKHRVKKKYKRYWQHGARAGTGLDTAHRPQDVSEDEMRIRWCITWHYNTDHWSLMQERCKTCGTTGEEIHPFLSR